MYQVILNTNIHIHSLKNNNIDMKSKLSLYFGSIYENSHFVMKRLKMSTSQVHSLLSVYQYPLTVIYML